MHTGYDVLNVYQKHVLKKPITIPPYLAYMQDFSVNIDLFQLLHVS